MSPPASGPPWRPLLLPSVAAAAVVALLLMATPGPDVDGGGGERHAIAAMQQIAAAQQAFAASAAIDVDGDGHGEFGYLGELTGAARLRLDPHGRLGHDVLAEPLLPLDLAAVQGGAATVGGYLVQVLLPGADDSWLPEQDDGGGAGCAVVADAAERRFRAYAWPLEPAAGTRAFAVDERGTVLAFANTDRRYLGRDRPVPAHALDAADAAAGWTPVR